MKISKCKVRDDNVYKIGSFFYSVESALELGEIRDYDEGLFRFANAGITGIQVEAEIGDRINLTELLNAMKNNGIEFHTIHTAFSCGYKDEDSYQKSLEHYKNAMKFAGEMNSPILMMVPQKPAGYVDYDYIKFRSAVRRLIGDMCEFSRAATITPTIEDYSFKSAAYGLFSDIKYLLDHNPELMFTYDSGNFVLAGNDELEGAHLFADRTVSVHFKDLVYDEEHIEFVRDGVCYNSVAIGDGMLRNKKALEVLKRGRFKEGSVIIETGYIYNCFENTLKSADYIKTIL